MERRTFLTQLTTATLAMTTASPTTSPGGEKVPVPDLPAADLGALEQSVQEVIDRNRIGRPVFIRYTLLGPLKQDEMLALLSRMLDAARRWLGQPIGKVYAVGSLEGGQVSLTMQTPDGATALLSVGRTRATGDGIDLMVVGDHGAIYHDAGQGLLGCNGARYQRPGSEPKLLGLIERVLASGRPVQPLAEEMP